MCPAALVFLGKMPTTTSGKLDRRLIAELPLSSDRHRLEASERKEQILSITDTEKARYGKKLLVCDIELLLAQTFSMSMAPPCCFSAFRRI